MSSISKSCANMSSMQCFCITDVTAVISSESPFPFIDVCAISY